MNIENLPSYIHFYLESIPYKEDNTLLLVCLYIFLYTIYTLTLP